MTDRDKEQRLAGIDADIKRLLDRAADKASGNMVSFGSALLAAKLLSIRSQPTLEEKPESDKKKMSKAIHALIEHGCK